MLVVMFVSLKLPVVPRCRSWISYPFRLALLLNRIISVYSAQELTLKAHPLRQTDGTIDKSWSPLCLHYCDFCLRQPRSVVPVGKDASNRLVNCPIYRVPKLAAIRERPTGNLHEFHQLNSSDDAPERVEHRRFDKMR